MEGLADPERDLVAQHGCSSASRGGAGRGSGTRGAAPRSRWCGPRRERAACRTRARNVEARGDDLDRRRSAGLALALRLAPAGRPRPRSRRRPRRAPSRRRRPPPAGQRARSKTTWTMPLRSRSVRKMSSPRSRRRPTQPLSSTRRPASAARSSPAAAGGSARSVRPARAAPAARAAETSPASPRREILDRHGSSFSLSRTPGARRARFDAERVLRGGSSRICARARESLARAPARKSISTTASGRRPRIASATPSASGNSSGESGHDAGRARGCRRIRRRDRSDQPVLADREADGRQSADRRARANEIVVAAAAEDRVLRAEARRETTSKTVSV